MKLSLKRMLPVAVMAAALVTTGTLRAQTVDASKADPALAKQIAEMQAKAAQLQGALAQNTSPTTKKPRMAPMPAASPMAGMSPGMTPGGGMGMEKMEKGQMGGMQNKPPAASSEMAGMMGMMGMMKDMKMGGMPAGSSGMAGMPKSALPGFPGVSHLYHIGATGLFLDHAEQINLSSDQQAALNKMKQQALAAKSSSEQQIEQAEQELGDLTSSDRPDAAMIDKRVHDIEKLRADERLAFIRTVGEAAKLLTDDQQKLLTGAMPPAAPAPSPSATMAPMSDM